MLSAAEIDSLKNDLRDFYNNFPRYTIMGSYAQLCRLQSDKQFIKFLFEKLTPEMDVLDVGAGSGLITLEISRFVKSVTGIDISSKAISLATALKEIEYRRYKLIEEAMKLDLNSKNIQNVKYIIGDAEKLYFEDEKFDVIIALDLIEHLPAPIAAINEMIRCLKKGGMIYLSFSTPVIDTNLNIQSWKDDFSAMTKKDALSKMNYNVLKSWFKRKKISILKYDIKYKNRFINFITHNLGTFKGHQALENEEESVVFILHKD